MRQQPKRVFGYARVSSAEQALGTSLQDQQDVIRAHAKKIGLKVDKMFVEAESAIHEKIEKREQVQAILAGMRTGDLILVDKIDRWSRDPEFCYRSTRLMAEASVDFYAISEDIDPSTPSGDTMLGMRILFAREEHKRTKVRMVGTRRLLRDKGFYSEGRPPWGYERQDKKGADRNVLVVVESEAEIVRDVFRRAISGESLNEIAASTNQSRDRVYRALRNRAYLGEMENSSGEWKAGQHSRIIEPHTFVAAREALDTRKHTRPGHESRTSDWWIRDIARCAYCAAKMRSVYANQKYFYYACYKNCTTRYVPVREVELVCEPIVASHLVELRHELAAPAREERVVAIVNVKERIAALDRKLESYVESCSEGMLSREKLREHAAKILAQRTKLEAMEHIPAPISKKTTIAVLANIETLRLAWSKTTPAEKRQVIGQIAKAVMLARGALPKFDWYSRESLLRRGLPGKVC